MLLVGVQFNTLGLQYGYSDAACYAVQIGNKRVNFTFRFGLPSRYKELDPNIEHEYRISGYYFQPGVTFFLGKEQHQDGKYLQYVRLMAHFYTQKHNLNITFADKYWGTSQEYRYSSTYSEHGGLMEWGAMFAIYKRLKMDCNIGFGIANHVDEPLKELPQISNTSYVPGVGAGYGFYGAVNIGLYFQL